MNYFNIIMFFNDSATSQIQYKPLPRANSLVVIMHDPRNSVDIFEDLHQIELNKKHLKEQRNKIERLTRGPKLTRITVTRA